MIKRKVRLLESGGTVSVPEPGAPDDSAPLIPDGIDANDVFFDDNDQIVSYFNRETNETIRFENGKPVVENPAGGDPADQNNPPADDPGENDLADGDQDGDDSDDGGNGDDTQYHNHAHYVLKQYGYEQDSIEMEDGTQKPIADLTEEEQLNLLAVEFDNIKAFYESKIEELENAPSTDFKDENEKEIITFLRNGGNPVDLAKKILDTTPGAGVDRMSDSDIVRQSLKETFDSLTDEEIDEELSTLSEAQIKRKAEILREKISKQDPALANLTKDQLAERQAAIDAQEKEFQTEVTQIRDYVEKINEIAGVKVTPEIKNFLLSEITASNVNEDSNFIKSLSSPDRLARLQFLDSYAEDLIQETAKKYFEKGKEEGSKQLRKFSSKPVPVKGAGQSSIKTQKKQVKSIESPDFYETETF